MAACKRKASGNEGNSTRKREKTTKSPFLSLPRGTVSGSTSRYLLISVPQLRDIIYASCQDTVYLRKKKPGYRKRRGIPGWLGLTQTCREIRREFCLMGPFRVSSLDAQELIQVFLPTEWHLKLTTDLIVDIPFTVLHEKTSFDIVHSIMSQYRYLSMHLGGIQGTSFAIRLYDQQLEPDVKLSSKSLPPSFQRNICCSWE
jgi:hypothetical protein